MHKSAILSEGISSIVGGWTDQFEKYAQVKLDQLPRVRGENEKYFKPPPRKQ